MRRAAEMAQCNPIVCDVAYVDHVDHADIDG